MLCHINNAFERISTSTLKGPKSGSLAARHEIGEGPQTIPMQSSGRTADTSVRFCTNRAMTPQFSLIFQSKRFALWCDQVLCNRLPYATYLFLSTAQADIDIGCRGWSRRMRGMQPLRVLFALMFMALPALQAKAAGDPG
jgi:hypothetical protein